MRSSSSRRTCLGAVFALVAAGCAPDVPPGPTHAVVTSVTVEALPLGTDWDGTVAPNPPDVYVDLNEVDGPFPGPLVRTEVAEDVGESRLPLALRPGRTARAVPLRASIRVAVVDRDQGGLDDDDELFSTGTLRLGARIGDAVAGDTTQLAFGDDRTRVRVSVRWE